MAWVMRNLFIDDAPAEEQLVEALRELVGENRAATPLTISPALEGWRAVCGAGGWIDDLPTAGKALAQRFSRRVISCELIAHSYLLRVGEHRSDGDQKLLQSPDLPWGAAEPHRGEMPLYEDVEARALATLVAMGAPRALVLAGVVALGEVGREELGEAMQLGSTEEGQLEERRCALSAPILPGGVDAPVVPRENDAGFGLSLGDERYVEGRPSGRAVDRLMELEEALSARASCCVPETQIHLTVAYHGGSFQADLDAQLRARDHFVPPSPRPPQVPWWQFWRYFGLNRK